MEEVRIVVAGSRDGIADPEVMEDLPMPDPKVIIAVADPASGSRTWYDAGGLQLTEELIHQAYVHMPLMMRLEEERNEIRDALKNGKRAVGYALLAVLISLAANLARYL